MADVMQSVHVADLRGNICKRTCTCTKRPLKFFKFHTFIFSILSVTLCQHYVTLKRPGQNGFVVGGPCKLGLEFQNRTLR